jgi:UDP-N-acetylglucosamine 2-epimerase
MIRILKNLITIFNMILICYGTRPEFIKIKPVIEGIKGIIPFKTLFTGQHKHIIQSEYKPDYSLEIPEGNNRLDSVLISGMNIDSSIFENVTHVLVQGDTTSVLSLAMASFHRGLKVIHLEAGLRTYDFENPFPEEANRQLVSRITDIHLCPTELNKQNLIDEKNKGDKFVVGNTVLDNLKQYKEKCTYGNKVLITLHRRENHEEIELWFKAINDIATEYKDLEFILPIHPNPNVQKHKDILTNVNVIEPLAHNELLDLLCECRFVISDSGGLQEECSFLNKKVIVCRKITERPESINTHSFMCKSPDLLEGLVIIINNDYEVDEPCPYGDGNSVEKIIEVLKSKIV